jgi:mycofactocin system glycosyltransferase
MTDGPTDGSRGCCAGVCRAKLAGPASTRLPVGFTVALDRHTRVLDGGTALLGGPGRLLHLAPAAQRLLPAGADTLEVRDATSAALARRLLDAGLANPVPERLPDAPAPAEVTVVVPVRDRPEGLRRLLAAVTGIRVTGIPATGAAAAAAAAATEVAQVIVIDDGSRDADRCRAVAEAAGATVLRHPVSRGPAAARNTGLAAATSEYVAFLDSDVVPVPGWLAALLAHLVDPAVAVVAPRIVGLPVPDPGWLTRYEGLRSSLDLGPDPGPVLPRSRVAYVPSAALLVRRAALGSGFAEDMPVAEDVDLGLRLHAAGWRIRYEPAALVAHEHRVAPVAWWTRKAFYGTGAAPLAISHPGSVPPAVLAPWTAAVCLLVAVQRPKALLTAVAVTGFATVRLRRTLHRLHGPGRQAVRLAGTGLQGSAGQCAGLLTRHWWPLTALACVFSRRARRAALLAALAEGGYDWWVHRPNPPQLGLDPLRYLIAHRLDDLGYGAGLWWGAVRRRTPAPLLPMITGLPRRRTTR